MPITLALLAMTVRIATLAKTINSGNVRPSTPSDVFLLRERIRFPPAQVLLLRHQVTHGEHTKLSNARMHGYGRGRHVGLQSVGGRNWRVKEGACGQCCQMAKFDPFLSLDCARVEGVGAQSKERKGSNFAA